MDCRVFEYEDKIYEVPTHSMLADDILKGLFNSQLGCSCSKYELQENLKSFYLGKDKV